MVLFISGASVRASKSLHRHIIAFEYDSILYKEVLVHLLPQAEEVQSVKVTRSSPKKKRPLENADEPEKKTVAKRACK